MTRTRGEERLDLRSERHDAVVVVARDRPTRTHAAKILTDAEIPVEARVGSIDAVIPLCIARPSLAVIVCCEAEQAPGILRPLKRAAPATRTILVVCNGDGRVLRSTLRRKVEAVVYGSQLDDALVPTVRAVFAELVVFPRGERRSLEPPALSYREREVLRLAIQGLTNDEIGARLYLATSTVKSHLTSAFSKLAVRSRSEAAALIFNPEDPAGRAILAELNGNPQPATPR
jgi:DNA-binding NarL/FixJ family response regulator